MFLNKKAKGEGASIATVLIIIALFMIFYLLFLPPEDRRNLLDVKEDGKTTTTTKELIELLAVSPGVLSPTKEFATKHSMPSVNLYVKTEPKIEKLVDNLVVKKGLFTKLSPQLRFITEEVGDTKSVTLNFFVQESSGTLLIKLNNQVVYSEEVKEPGAKIIDINPNLLKDQNELEFSVSSGIFRVNKYNLQKIILKQEFQKINSKEERLVTVSEEGSSLSRVALKYTQVCNSLQSDTTVLDIHINEVRVLSQNIKCITTSEELDIETSLLKEGKNTLTFTLEEGDFSFNQISLETESKDSKFLTYQFSIPSKEYNKIKEGKKVELELLLSQQRKNKNARIVINSDDVLMSTESGEFSRDITDLVVEGTNFLRIIPSNTFTIDSLKVTLE